MIRILILLVFLGGCTQQKEAVEIPPSDPESKHLLDFRYLKGNYMGVDSIYVPKPKFDSTKHYIISVDTVGWEMEYVIVGVDTGQLIETWWWVDPPEGESNKYYVDTVPTHEDRYGWVEKISLDTTWADKEHLLVTPEEADKLKKLITE